MTIVEKIEALLSENQTKLDNLNQKLSEAYQRVEYLQLEVRMITEVELPQASTKRVLEGDGKLEAKLKKDLEKYREELADKQAEVMIIQNAIQQYQVSIGEEVAKLEAMLREERKLIEAKAYAKMLHAKKQYVDAMIEEGKSIQAMNQLDTKLQELLVQAGRKNQVYSDTTIKANPTNHGSRFDGRYLGVSWEETQRFITGNFTGNDYDGLKKYANRKDLN